MCWQFSKWVTHKLSSQQIYETRISYKYEAVSSWSVSMIYLVHVHEAISLLQTKKCSTVSKILLILTTDPCDFLPVALSDLPHSCCRISETSRNVCRGRFEQTAFAECQFRQHGRHRAVPPDRCRLHIIQQSGQLNFDFSSFVSNADAKWASQAEWRPWVCFRTRSATTKVTTNCPSSPSCLSGRGGIPVCSQSKLLWPSSRSIKTTKIIRQIKRITKTKHNHQMTVPRKKRRTRRPVSGVCGSWLWQRSNVWKIRGRDLAWASCPQRMSYGTGTALRR